MGSIRLQSCRKNVWEQQSFQLKKISHCQREARWTRLFLVRNWRNSFLQTMEMKNPFPAIVRIKGTSSWETKPRFFWIFCNSVSNWLMKKRKTFHKKPKRGFFTRNEFNENQYLLISYIAGRTVLAQFFPIPTNLSRWMTSLFFLKT